jgi:hypothetical protein
MSMSSLTAPSHPSGASHSSPSQSSSQAGSNAPPDSKGSAPTLDQDKTQRSRVQAAAGSSAAGASESVAGAPPGVRRSGAGGHKRRKLDSAAGAAQGQRPPAALDGQQAVQQVSSASSRTAILARAQALLTRPNLRLALGAPRLWEHCRLADLRPEHFDQETGIVPDADGALRGHMLCSIKDSYTIPGIDTVGQRVAPADRKVAAAGRLYYMIPVDLLAPPSAPPQAPGPLPRAGGADDKKRAPAGPVDEFDFATIASDLHPLLAAYTVGRPGDAFNLMEALRVAGGENARLSVPSDEADRVVEEQLRHNGGLLEQIPMLEATPGKWELARRFEPLLAPSPSRAPVWARLAALTEEQVTQVDEQNRRWCLAAVSQRSDAVRSVPEYLKSDPTFWEAARAENWAVVRFMPVAMWTPELFQALQDKHGNDAWLVLPQELKPLEQYTALRKIEKARDSVFPVDSHREASIYFSGHPISVRYPIGVHAVTANLPEIRASFDGCDGDLDLARHDHVLWSQEPVLDPTSHGLTYLGWNRYACQHGYAFSEMAIGSGGSCGPALGRDADPPLQDLCYAHLRTLHLGELAHAWRMPDPNFLRDIPNEKRGPIICRLAVEANLEALRHVPPALLPAMRAIAFLKHGDRALEGIDPAQHEAVRRGALEALNLEAEGTDDLARIKARVRAFRHWGEPALTGLSPELSDEVRRLAAGERE